MLALIGEKEKTRPVLSTLDMNLDMFHVCLLSSISSNDLHFRVSCCA